MRAERTRASPSPAERPPRPARWTRRHAVGSHRKAGSSRKRPTEAIRSKPRTADFASRSPGARSRRAQRWSKTRVTGARAKHGRSEMSGWSRTSSCVARPGRAWTSRAARRRRALRSNSGRATISHRRSGISSRSEGASPRLSPSARADTRAMPTISDTPCAPSRVPTARPSRKPSPRRCCTPRR